MVLKWVFEEFRGLVLCGIVFKRFRFQEPGFKGCVCALRVSGLGVARFGVWSGG